MKKINIVLSFDDGLIDFKENALPVLERFGIKGTINIVSGFLDGSINNGYVHLTIDDIKMIKQMGHEIAVHSNSHTKNSTIEDFILCRNKLNKIFGDDSYGVVIPYSRIVPKQLVKDFRESGFLYLCDYGKKECRKPLYAKIARVIYHFYRNKHFRIFLDGYSYVYNRSDFNKFFPCFFRLPASRDNRPKDIIRFLKKVKNDSYIVIMLHSIINDKDTACEWPYGAWTIDEFNYFLSVLTKKKGIRFFTQKGMIDYAKSV